VGSYEESLRSVSFSADASIAVFTGPPGVPGSAVPNAGMIYRAVKITGADTVGLCTVNTDTVVGVLQNKPQVVGQAATVAIRGITNMVVGVGGLAAGAAVGTDGTGRAIAAVSTKQAIGILLQPSSAVGEVLPVLLRPGYAA
jgi:hypothetical protein